MKAGNNTRRSSASNVFEDDQMTSAFSVTEDGLCEGCELGKSRMLPFSKAGATRATHKLATKAVSGKTPIEAWSGIKPSIQHLKVFGSISYYHIPDIKRSKLDAKARKGIFGRLCNRRAYWDWNMDEVKRHEDTFLNETYHDKVDIHEFDIEDTNDTDVLRTRRLVNVYESCNSIIEPESYMDARHKFLNYDATRPKLK
ncbi:hypothetical protein Tco_0534642 [Tanacetum coccineum]